MGFVPSPSQYDVQAAVRAFLLSIMPPGMEIVRGLDNRVPEPQGADFIVLTPIRRERLATNIHSSADCAFTASITGAVMTVADMQLGAILVPQTASARVNSQYYSSFQRTSVPDNAGRIFTCIAAGLTALSEPAAYATATDGVSVIDGGAIFQAYRGPSLFGIGIADGTTILSQLSGTPGGIGTYQLSASPTISPETLASGAYNYLQKTELTIQCDVHGPNSADNAQTISTLFRDEYCVNFLQGQGLDAVPLYSEDPRLMPFQNAEQAWETRWVVDLCLEANMVVSPPQQYLTAINVSLNEVL